MSLAFRVEFRERGVSTPFSVELMEESESEPAELTLFSMEFSLECTVPRLDVEGSRRLVLRLRFRRSRELTLLPSEELTLEVEPRRLPDPKLRSEPAELIRSPTGPRLRSITSRDPVFSCNKRQ